MAAAKNTPATSNDKATDNNAPETVKFTVNLRGQEVELEALADPLDGPADIMLAMEKQQYTTYFYYLLGEAQFARLRAYNVSARDFVETIIPAYHEAAELPGEA